MAMTFTIRTTVEDHQIIDLLKLYLIGGEKLTKANFVDHIKNQVQLFGTTDEFLLGNNMDEYPELTDEQMNLLEKWKLLGE